MPSASEDLDRADARRVLAGDIDAFAGIVGRWQRPLVNLAFRFCRDHARAEDMAQEAFLRAYRHLHQWRGEAAFSTWLFALALNVYRSTTRARRRSEVAADLPDVQAPGDLLEEVIARDTDEAVRHAVLTLPPHYRDAMIVFYFADRSLADAARYLGIADGTLKARLHRGRAFLKAKLAHVLDARRKRP